MAEPSTQPAQDAAARRARRRAAARRRAGRARLLAVLLVLGAGAVAAGLLSSAGGAQPAALGRRATAHVALSIPSASPPATAPSAPSPAQSAPVRPATRATLPRSPGSLPQTHAYPPGSGTQFRGLMEDLWRGVVRDSVASALPAFFPRGAYVQLKAIAGAGSDWSERLVHDYRLDVEAAHAQLGRHASDARLLRVVVDESYGHWVPPGVCDNGIGYYEMPGARVVYRSNGVTRSFGIASMISWRGVWYVVHLGAILRSGGAGVVDEPAAGPGRPAPSGTC